MGGPYEGQPGPVEVRDDHEWRLSDDTQLTLAACEAYTRSGKLSPESTAESMLRWFQEGRLSGLGASTLKALRDLGAGAHWALAGRRGEMSAGNGAAMRVAPLAFVIDTESFEGRSMLRDLCRITHHNDEAYVGALAVVAAVNYMASGRWRPGESLVDPVLATLPDSRVRDRMKELALLDADKPVRVAGAELGTSGYVVDSVPLAIFAAQKVSRGRFSETVRFAIEAGGDTDTIGSMTGQIAGAWVGWAELRSLVAHLEEGESVLAVAKNFARSVAAG